MHAVVPVSPLAPIVIVAQQTAPLGHELAEQDVARPAVHALEASQVDVAPPPPGPGPPPPAAVQQTSGGLHTAAFAPVPHTNGFPWTVIPPPSIAAPLLLPLLLLLGPTPLLPPLLLPPLLLPPPSSVLPPLLPAVLLLLPTVLPLLLPLDPPELEEPPSSVECRSLLAPPQATTMMELAKTVAKVW